MCLSVTLFNLIISQKPSCSTSVYDNEEQFLANLIGQKQPTFFACGGKYANLKEVGVEKIPATGFSFGVGGLTMKHRTKLLRKECLD